MARDDTPTREASEEASSKDIGACNETDIEPITDEPPRKRVKVEMSRRETSDGKLDSGDVTVTAPPYEEVPSVITGSRWVAINDQWR